MNAIKVTFDREHLAARLKNGKQRCGKMLAQQILDDCRPFIPHDQGTLEDSGRVEQVGGDFAAVWDAKYAAYQYYGCWPDGSHVVQNHDTSVNAQATTLWVEHAKQLYGDNDWQTVAQREFTAGAGS